MKTFRHIALTLASLLALSCAKEVQPECNEETVTVQYGITVDAPTKALGDGKTANYVWYALYRADGSLVSECTAPAKVDIATGKAICPVTMAKDQDYKIVFLAMHYEVDGATKTPAYVVDSQNKTVTMPAVAKANSDNFDLFYGTDDVVDFQGAQNTNVQLSRVVAQVNFELSEASWNALGVNSSFMSEIVISNAPASMNLWDRTLGGKTDVAYSKAAVPSEDRKVGTAYCFAPADESATLKVNTAIKVYTNDTDNQPKNASASDIQVMANKKTNLIISTLN